MNIKQTFQDYEAICERLLEIGKWYFGKDYGLEHPWEYYSVGEIEATYSCYSRGDTTYVSLKIPEQWLEDGFDIKAALEKRQLEEAIQKQKEKEENEAIQREMYEKSERAMYERLRAKYE